MLYNIDFDIAAIVISLFTIYYIIIKKGLWKAANKIYMVIVFAILISSITDIASAVTISYPERYSVVVQSVWTHLYLAVCNITPFLFVLYILCVLKIMNRFRRIHIVLIGIPVVISLFVILCNPFFHWAFYFDTDGTYMHGGMMMVLYAIAFLYLIAVGIFMIRYKKMLPEQKWQPLMLFSMLSIASVVVQMLVPSILFGTFFQAIGLLSVLFSIESRDDTMNPITKVYNRYSFLEEVGAAFKRRDTWVLVAKLPNIGFYNTTAGMKQMNEIQQEIAGWLDGLNKGLDCYDCENGHFALVGNIPEQVDELKARILERFLNSWGFGTFQIILPVQLCVVQIPEDAGTIEELLLVLDLVYNGSESEEISAKEVLSTYQQRILIENKIQEALVRHRFQVWYQPIWNREKGCVRSAEALIRLYDDELGYISPMEFIPIAEQNGTIIEIGAFVLEEVCRFYQEQKLNEKGIDYIEVNLSAVQCMNSGLVEAFEKILEKYGLDAKHINLEITESATADNQGMLMGTVHALAKKDFSFSLDDYGTGYSNISYMYEMPFSIIKLDKSILWKAMNPNTGKRDKNAMVFLENTLRMLQEMHYKTLAEGVETKEQKILLEKLGCDFFQGYYFSKPVPGNVFLDYIQEVNV